MLTTCKYYKISVGHTKFQPTLIIQNDVIVAIFKTYLCEKKFTTLIKLEKMQ